MTNCDQLPIFLNMVHLYRNKNIKTLIVSVLRNLQVQVELEDPISIIYSILDHIFQILDTTNVLVKQIIPCQTILSQKSKMILPTSSKNHIILREKLKISLKNPQMTLRNCIQIYQRKRKEKGSWACGCFLPKSRYHSIYILQKIIPILKVNFHLTLEVFLKYMIILELG